MGIELTFDLLTSDEEWTLIKIELTCDIIIYYNHYAQPTWTMKIVQLRKLNRVAAFSVTRIYRTVVSYRVVQPR
jgi:hypothetical protein